MVKISFVGYHMKGMLLSKQKIYSTIVGQRMFTYSIMVLLIFLLVLVSKSFYTDLCGSFWWFLNSRRRWRDRKGTNPPI